MCEYECVIAATIAANPGVFTVFDLHKMDVPLFWKELARVTDLRSRWSGCSWCWACRLSPGLVVSPGKIPKSASERLSMLAECLAREDASSWGWGECNNHIRLPNTFRYIPGNAFCRALLHPAPSTSQRIPRIGPCWAKAHMGQVNLIMVMADIATKPVLTEAYPGGFPRSDHHQLPYRLRLRARLGRPFYWFRAAVRCYNALLRSNSTTLSKAWTGAICLLIVFGLGSL
eukprot:1140017-Pelagomonas_calceolata.AAC.1